jgi:hypothetical protein
MFKIKLLLFLLHHTIPNDYISSIYKYIKLLVKWLFLIYTNKSINKQIHYSNCWPYAYTDKKNQTKIQWRTYPQACNFNYTHLLPERVVAVQCLWCWSYLLVAETHPLQAKVIDKAKPLASKSAGTLRLTVNLTTEYYSKMIPRLLSK